MAECETPRRGQAVVEKESGHPGIIVDGGVRPRVSGASVKVAWQRPRSYRDRYTYQPITEEFVPLASIAVKSEDVIPPDGEHFYLTDYCPRDPKPPKPAKAYPPRPCKHCGREDWTPRTSNAVYCSDDCRKACYEDSLAMGRSERREERRQQRLREWLSSVVIMLPAVKDDEIDAAFRSPRFRESLKQARDAMKKIWKQE
jgi:hypothetical protein